MPIELTLLYVGKKDDDNNLISKNVITFDNDTDLKYYISTGIMNNCIFDSNFDSYEHPINDAIDITQPEVKSQFVLIFPQNATICVTNGNNEYNIQDITFISYEMVCTAFAGYPIVKNFPVVSKGIVKYLMKKLKKYFIEVSKDEKLEKDPKIEINNYNNEDKNHPPYSSFHFHSNIISYYRESSSDDDEYEFDCSINIHHTQFRTFIELECITIPTCLQSQGILSGIVKILADFMREYKLGELVFSIDGSDEGWTTMAFEKYNLYPDWTIGEIFNLKCV